MADANLSDFGTDPEVAHALNLIVDYGRSDPADEVVRLALDYLRALIPPNSHARALLVTLADNLDSYRCGLWSDVSGIDDFGPVADTAHLLRDCLDTAGAPRVKRPRTAAELAEIAAELGVRSDWHEPDGRGVYTRQVRKPASSWLAVTDGSFDNAGSRVLEQTVVVYRDRIPVAEVVLATLFAWASAAGRPDLTPPAVHVAEVEGQDSGGDTGGAATQTA